MACKLWIGILLIILPMIQGAVETRITVDGAQETSSGKHIVRPGAAFTINCYVQDFNVGVAVASIRKLVGEEQKDVKITSNDNLESIISDNTDRYFSNYTSADNSFTFHVYISDSQEVDTGTYTCGVSGESGSTPLEIIVASDSFEVDFYVDDEEVDDEREEDLDAVSVKQFRCVVQGDIPDPKVRLYLGEGEDAEDITDRLSDQQRSSSVQWQQENPAVDWMHTVEYTVTLAGNLTVEASFSRKPLTCGAYDAEQNPPVTSSSNAVTFVFSQFKPAFVGCDEDVQIGFLQNFSIECRVSAEPRVDAVYFMYPLDGVNITLTPEEQATRWLRGKANQKWGRDSRFVGVLYEDRSTDVMRLISDTTHAFMYQTYYFVARNTVGQTVHAVTVVEDPTDTYQMYLDERNSAEKWGPEALLFSLVVGLIVKNY